MHYNLYYSSVFGGFSSHRRRNWEMVSIHGICYKSSTFLPDKVPIPFRDWFTPTTSNFMLCVAQQGTSLAPFKCWTFFSHGEQTALTLRWIPCLWRGASNSSPKSCMAKRPKSNLGYYSQCCNCHMFFRYGTSGKGMVLWIHAFHLLNIIAFFS